MPIKDTTVTIKMNEMDDGVIFMVDREEERECELSNTFFVMLESQEKVVTFIFLKSKSCEKKRWIEEKRRGRFSSLFVCV